MHLASLKAEMVYDNGSVVAAFTALPAVDRRLLMLTAWHGYRTRKVAVILGCSPGAATTRLWRARNRLSEANAMFERARP
jgi:RNA polymerase sigma-70 factor (ECF subfamily)